ncbi:MAG: 3-deoxy-manno-octulosonate cytidylyltransferase [Nitrospirae bacterium]|nr:3-deoxy-manno-octulosonate cytidylyltransferase [Nitrospirota bacterium]
MPKAVAIIPARFNSTRFPGKPLATLKGKIIIQHVFERVSAAKLIDAVLVATDDQRIFDAVTSFGGKAVMTSGSHVSGTDRIAEATSELDCDFVINVQGDEPFIRPEMVDEVVEVLYNDDKVSISTLAKRTTDINEIFSPNVVKVVMSASGFALYFSRAPIPFYRDEWQMKKTEDREQKTEDRVSTFDLSTLNSQLSTSFCYKHIGIYGFHKNALLSFTSLKEGRLERIEKLEQLRALESGMRIKVRITEHDTFGIDTIEDLRKAEEWQNISL